MSANLNENVWITIMHEVQSFVRENLERPEVMAELRLWMGPAARTRSGAAEKPEIIRAFELLAPGLLVDFLETHQQLLDRTAVRRWAEEREGLYVNLLSAS